MIEYNPIYKKNGSLNGAITTAPSNSLIFDLAGKAIWAKGVKLKGTDHTYTFSHDNYITLTNTPGSDESEDIKIGVNITTLKAAIDTTYSVVTASSDGLAPMFSSGNLADTDNTDHYYLGIKGSTLKWYKNAYRQLKVGDNIVLGVTDRDPLQIVSADSNLSVSWNSTNKLLVIKNEKPAIGDLTDINVSQFKVTDNTNYRLLFKGTANDNNYTGVSRFSEYLLFNPSTKLLTINGNRVITAVDVYVGATSEANATVGLVPAATSAQRTYFLRGDGTWLSIVQENTWRPIKVNSSEKLGSGTDTGAVDFVAGTGITLGWDATNKKITITNSAPDQDHNTDRTGIYKGTVSGTKKTDTTLIVANTSSGLIFEGGTNLFKIGDGTNYVEIPVTPSFTVTDKSASILSSLTTLATIAGTDIKAKVAVVDSSPTLTTSLKTIATIAGVEIKAKITNYNTDENVKLTPKTDNVNRPLMMINGGTSAGELTSTSMFSTGIYANASTKMITANGFIKAGSDDTYVLLAGGGAKALSDFAMAHSHPYLPLTGGNMTGNIGYTGSMATYTMITFINNMNDNYGNGISIGGGGLTIIGGGESASVIAAQHTSGGDENMCIGNDGNIDFYSNLQNGWDSRREMTFATDGNLYIGGNKVWHVGNDGSGSGLDADLLDGKHASDFATSGHNHDGRYARTHWSFASGSDNANTTCTDLGTWISRLGAVGGISDYGSISSGSWWWVRSTDLQVNGWNIRTSGAMMIYCGDGSFSSRNYKHFLILDAYADLYGITSNEESWKYYTRFLNNRNYTDYVNPRAVSKTIYGGTYIDADGNFLSYSGNLNMTTGDQMNFLDPNNDGVAFNYNNNKSSASSIRIYNGRMSEIARFNTSGNFGIGISSPSLKLDVYGNICVGNGTGESHIYAHTTNFNNPALSFYDDTSGYGTMSVLGGGGCTVVGGGESAHEFAPNVRDENLYLTADANVNIFTNLDGGYGSRRHVALFNTNGDTYLYGNLYLGANTSNNFIAFYGNTGDDPGSYATSFIGEHLWGSPESTELLLMKFNDVGNGTSGTSIYSSGPDRIRHLAHAHVFQIMTSTAQGSFTTMANSTAYETKLEICRNCINSFTSIILKGSTTADMSYSGNVHPYIRFDNSDSSQNVSFIFTDWDDYRSPAGIKLVGNQGGEWFEAPYMYATTFYGNLSGTATNADTLDGYHASGLLTSATLGASGNNTTVSVTVGGTTRTGSVIVPYATVTSKIWDPDYHDYSHRRASANINYADGALHYYLATSTMTTGKPSYDAHILHMAWDNGSWEGQLALPTSGYMQWRTMNGGTWTNWYTILDSSNYTSYCATSGHNHDDRYVNVTGDTMTGTLYTASNYYSRLTGSGGGIGALHLNNSDITGVNSIITSDTSEDWTESLAFKRDNGNHDTFRASNGTFYFGVNNGTETGAYLGSGSQYINYMYCNQIHGGTNNNLWLHSSSNIYITPSSSSTDGNNCFVFSSNCLNIRGATTGTMTYSTTAPRIVFSENGTQAVGICYTDWDAYRASKGIKIMDVDNNDTGNVWLEVQGHTYSAGFVKNGSSDSYVLLGGGGHKALSDFTGSSDVYWKDVKDKIRHSNEFNIVPSGYNSTMWFNYRSDADTNVTVSEYIFGNGSGSASAAIKSGTVYPGSNASYDIGKTGSRWNYGYFSSGIYIGGTSYTGPHTNAAGTTIASGYIEMNASDPYIDFHRSGYYTSDYSSRLIHWNNRDRLYYECYSSTYSGYVATCEGNANNLVIIGVFDLYKTNDTTLTWSISTICGPCSFSLQKNNSIYDVSFKSRTSSPQSWTISGNVLRVYVNGPSSNAYAWKSTPYAVSCDARVMTRWINHQPVVTNCLHGAWVGSSIECLCTNLSNGSSLYYYSSSPGRYIYITGSRPWGYDDGSNGMGMDMMRVTGDESYQRIRFTVFGYLS